MNLKARYNTLHYHTTQEDIDQAEEELRSRTKLYSLDDMVNALDVVRRRIQFEADRQVNVEKEVLRQAQLVKEAEAIKRLSPKLRVNRVWDERFDRIFENTFKEAATVKEAPFKSRPKKTSKKRPARKKKA